MKITVTETRQNGSKVNEIELDFVGERDRFYFTINRRGRGEFMTSGGFPGLSEFSLDETIEITEAIRSAIEKYRKENA